MAGGPGSICCLGVKTSWVCGRGMTGWMIHHPCCLMESHDGAPCCIRGQIEIYKLQYIKVHVLINHIISVYTVLGNGHLNINIMLSSKIVKFNTCIFLYMNYNYMYIDSTI